MRVAQKLYEAGLITYMRTDSMNLSDLCLNTVGPVITELMGADYHKRVATTRTPKVPKKRTKPSVPPTCAGAKSKALRKKSVFMT